MDIPKLMAKIISPVRGNDSRMAKPKSFHNRRKAPKSLRAVEIK
jgi:hypothetical protein